MQVNAHRVFTFVGLPTGIEWLERGDNIVASEKTQITLFRSYKSDGFVKSHNFDICSV
jgi:hypothetical protein